MSIPRFYAPHLTPSATCTIGGDEATHAIRSLRIQEGDSVILFDGAGYQALGTVTEVGKKEWSCSLAERRQLPGVLPGDTTLAIALPKGDRQKLLMERLVEMGIHRLIPIQSSRSVAEGTDNAIARLERYNIEACKQCGRNQLLEIATPIKFGALVEEMGNNERNENPTTLWIAHPYPSPGATERPLEQGTIHSSALIAIGPEGGFTEQEVAHALQSNWESLHMGPRILRVESAVSYACSLLHAHFDPPKLRGRPGP